MASRNRSRRIGAKAAFGSVLLALVAVVGTFADGPEASAPCVFAKGGDPQAIETSVRNWARTSGLGAVSQWNVSLDGSQAAVALVIETGTLTLSWQLDADCTPTSIEARGSAADLAAPAQATLEGLASGLPALHTRHREQGGHSSIPWAPLTLLAMGLVIVFAVVTLRALTWRRLTQWAIADAHAVAGRVLIALVGFGIGLVVVEIATRSTGLHTRMMAASLFYIRGGAIAEHRTSDDAFLHYELNPDSHTTFVKADGGTFAVNVDAVGARLPTHARAKPAGVFRILAFGGSTLFGANVNDEDTMAAAMERRLNRSAVPSNRHFEVWNFGTSAYNLAQAAHLARKHLADLDPDLIWVQLHNRFPRPCYLPSDGKEEEVLRVLLEKDELMLNENFPPPAWIPETLHAVAIRRSALYQALMGLYRRRVRPDKVSDALAALEAAALVREAGGQHVEVAFVAIPFERGRFNGDNAVYEGLPQRDFIDLYRPGREADFYEVHPPPRVLDEYAGLLLEEFEKRGLIPQHYDLIPAHQRASRSGSPPQGLELRCSTGTTSSTKNRGSLRFLHPSDHHEGRLDGGSALKAVQRDAMPRS